MSDSLCLLRDGDGVFVEARAASLRGISDAAVVLDVTFGRRTVRAELESADVRSLRDALTRWLDEHTDEPTEPEPEPPGRDVWIAIYRNPDNPTGLSRKADVYTFTVGASTRTAAIVRARLPGPPTVAGVVCDDA